MLLFETEYSILLCVFKTMNDKTIFN
jgi:hypothetical protein